MVRAVMIVEMAGIPAEHVKNQLRNHVEILRQVKDIEVHSIQVSEPKEIENSNGVFTCFSECDFETASFARLTETMFDFMPSSIEVIEPGKVTMDSYEASNFLNNISGRLHRYDEIAKIAKFKTSQLTKQLQEAEEKLKRKEENKKKEKKSSKKKVKKTKKK